MLKEHIELEPLKNWGTYIPRQDLETDLQGCFERILEKYWNELQRWHQVVAIYSAYYHHPEKAMFQRAIEAMENDIHEQLHQRAWVNFRLEPGDKDFNDFMIKFTYHEKIDADLVGYLERITKEKKRMINDLKQQNSLGKWISIIIIIHVRTTLRKNYYPLLS